MRTSVISGCLFLAVGLPASADAAPPRGKPAAKLPDVNADVLPPGHFAGVLVSPPNSERLFTLRITYPEVRLKQGARMPNLSNMHARGMQQILQQMHRAQQLPHMRGGYGGGYPHHYNALSNMMRMQQMYMQGQMRMQQAMARAEQQELRLLQQEVKAIQNMYQVVNVTRDFDFQLIENVKVRIKDPPGGFDEKGNIKKYTREELAVLKGKDKNLIGYESSLEALQPGQTLLVSLHSHKKHQKPLTSPVGKKENDDDKETTSVPEHKMQVTLVVILKGGDASALSTPKSQQNKK